jgi:hypothetical protein
MASWAKNESQLPDGRQAVKTEHLLLADGRQAGGKKELRLILSSCNTRDSAKQYNRMFRFSASTVDLPIIGRILKLCSQEENQFCI